MKKFYSNSDRHEHLRSLLMEGTHPDRMQAHKLAYEWVKKGTFDLKEFILYCERVADISAGLTYEVDF